MVAPSAAEPFQTLAMVYEDRKDWDKCFEVDYLLVCTDLSNTCFIDFIDRSSLETN